MRVRKPSKPGAKPTSPPEPNAKQLESIERMAEEDGKFSFAELYINWVFMLWLRPAFGYGCPRAFR